MHVIDTYAWIEYFKGSRFGAKIKRQIETKNNITPTIVLAEISKFFTDLNRKDLKEKLDFIRSQSQVLALDEATAIIAGCIRSTMGNTGMGIVDCILLAVARLHKTKVLTGDKHFKNLEDADYFEL